MTASHGVWVWVGYWVCPLSQELLSPEEVARMEEGLRTAIRGIQRDKIEPDVDDLYV